jgi:hypothetical protein
VVMRDASCLENVVPMDAAFLEPPPRPPVRLAAYERVCVCVCGDESYAYTQSTYSCKDTCDSHNIIHHTSRHYTPHTTLLTLHTIHDTLHSSHYILHTTYYILHTTYYILHTTYYTQHTTYYTLPTSAAARRLLMLKLGEFVFLQFA